jgi:predicted metal-dependent HD superfamily phosphohydrolase
MELIEGYSIHSSSTEKLWKELKTNYSNKNLYYISLKHLEHLLCELRKEYSSYPDFLHNKGRKRVIKYFLFKDKIYKTKEFYERYGNQAKINLKTELEFLNA